MPRHRCRVGLMVLKLRFRVFNVARFPAGPEADATWVNTKRFAELAPEAYGAAASDR